MKNQYFGDINDYRKYGLLRCIAQATGVSIGVLWLLTQDDGRSDGAFRHYLREPHKWARHDPPLYLQLRRLLEPDVVPNVEHAAAWRFLPGACYFSQLFTDDASQRTQVFQLATQALAHCPMLFLDPDNGIEVKSVRYGGPGSCKYVYWRELCTLFQRGHSLLIYQHYARLARDVFESQRATELRQRLQAPEVAVFSTAHVAFFLALQADLAPSLPAIARAVRSCWGGQVRHG